MVEYFIPGKEIGIGNMSVFDCFADTRIGPKADLRRFQLDLSVISENDLWSSAYPIYDGSP
tara:strand:- start:2942 stop:3124 length:183 start_codon:yes stop_codon:yes gene_type:complete